jgi:hypothetical protein
MSRVKLFFLLMTLVYGVVWDASAQCTAKPSPKMQSTAPTSSALIGLGNPSTFTIADRGAETFDTSGSGSQVTVGYARVQANTSSTTPSGYLIFSYPKNGVLVSEATVPESRPIASGRIYASVEGSVNTGVAIVNPNPSAVTISFYLTDSSGNNFNSGSFTLPANSQTAHFLNEPPFNATGTISGTFTFSASAPVGVIALRGFTNERGEFLMTTLPVADLNAAASADIVFFPHYAMGGGWTTQVILVNTSDAAISGSVTALSTGASLSLYSIAPRSMQRVVLSSSGSAIVSGGIRVTPDVGSTSPSGLSIFSFNNAGVTVSEAGVPTLRTGMSFRMYEIDCGTYPGQLQTGLAIANPSATVTATVTLELTDQTGASTGMTSVVTIPPLGQTAAFMKQFPGFEGIPYPFHGVVRISTSSPEGVAVIGLRGEYNERKDFLVTTSMPADESIPASATEALFPHLADGGGYMTEFVLFSGSTGQSSSGMLRFFTQTGAPLN